MADENTAGRTMKLDDPCVKYGDGDRPQYTGQDTENHIQRILASQYGPAVLAFAQAMVEKLDKNAHKGRWENCDKDDLFFRMMDECCEARTAFRENEPPEAQMKECADVGNFAMMLWELARTQK